MVPRMGDTTDRRDNPGQEPQESYGVLAGWTHRELQGHVDLRLQTIRSTRREKPGEPDVHHIVMTRGQAAVLANYLFQLSETTPPRRRRKGILGKLLEG